MLKNTKNLMLIFIIATGLFYKSLPLHANTPIETEPEQQQNAPENKEKTAIISCAHFIFGALALELCFLSADRQTQSRLIEQIKPHNLLKNFLVEYGTSFFVTFMHELGHALTAHYLNDNPIDIHLGASYSDLKDKEAIPIFSSQHVSLHGLNPNQALASYSIILDIATYLKLKLAHYVIKNNIDLTSLSEEERHLLLQKIVIENSEECNEFITTTIPKNIKKQAAILLAGSISGGVSATLLSLITTLIKEKNISEATVLNGLKPNSQVFRNLINMIIPRSSSGKDDASKLYHQCLGVPKEILAMVAHGAPFISFAAELALAYQEAEQTSSNNIASIGFVALFNFFMRGYLRFTL